ncbi:general substrate transporter [Cantharellus anzutake]|uniref:general substrate transporter n=1 Tax=Cantharellus anzutake TaxID=1750568 RepID=UPI0019061FE6|nr:general substrate transporter [Cantharellus anzutake]KAF8328155.1 general substrate transporter [Cantharellus anzutake]
MVLAIAGVPGAKSKMVGQPLLYAISIFASIGVFLFGYDQGVMSGIITGPYFLAYFNRPSRSKIGTMVAVLEIGAFITSVLAGRLGDILGRRRTLFFGASVFVLGGAIQSGATSYGIMVLGRLVSGAGVGLLSTIVPIYQSEVSPADHRGKLACIEFTGNIIGYASSVWLDYFCSFIQSHMAWRLPLLMQCVIGSILAIGSLLMPESPRWLIDHDFDELGKAVIVDLHGGDYDNPEALREFQEIKEAVMRDRESPDRSYAMMWKRYKGRVLLAMSAQAFAQLNGINVISYYAPLVFEQAGWIGRDALLMTGINALIYIASTIPTWYLVDMWGRRIILISGAAVMCIALSATGWWIYVDQLITPKAVVVCVIIFNAAFGYSWGPMCVAFLFYLGCEHADKEITQSPWLYPPEIMPLTVRAKGVSLSTATNWVFNFIVGEVTPSLQELIGWRLYTMHAFFCACSLILVYFLYPETMGVPLEEMDAVFGEEDILSDDDDDDDDEDEDDGLSETTSLVRDASDASYSSPREGPRSLSPVGGDNAKRSRRWFNVFRAPGKAHYTPVQGSEVG